MWFFVFCLIFCYTTIYIIIDFQIIATSLNFYCSKVACYFYKREKDNDERMFTTRPKKKAICDTMYYVQIDFMIKID